MTETTSSLPSDLLQDTRLSILVEGNEGDFRPGVEHLEAVQETYRQHMTATGYAEHEPVAITSGIDPTVRFIGSHISVLKPYLLEGRMSDGISLIQHCLRTHNVATLLDDNVYPRYGSFFTSLGGIAPAGSLERVCIDVVTFIASLHIDPSEIRAHVSSSDGDLLSVCSSVFSPDNIYHDTQRPSYYRHRIGVDGVTGRNFNLALPSPVTGSYEDIGNIIVVEEHKGQLGVEIALGDSTTLKQLYGLDHILDAYDLQLPQDRLEPALLRKMEDAIMTSVVLFQEGLRPGAANNKTRILRSYCKALAYYRRRARLSLEELDHVIADAESLRLPQHSADMHDDVISFVESYDEQLALGQIKNKEDERILLNLGKHGLGII